MRLARKVNLGGYNSMEFMSNERVSTQEAARDLIEQMDPLQKSYPILAQIIKELKSAYNV